MTALSIPRDPTSQSIGLHRRITRISDAEGHIRTMAIDHPENYLALFDSDLDAVSFEEVVASKLEMIRRLAPHATSVLIDPVWSFGQSVAAAAVPGTVGIVSGIEDLYYRPATSPVGFDTTLRLKPDWDPAKLAALGADAAKLVVFHRHDLPEDEQEQQHAVVARAAAACHRVHLPLVVEPLWFPRPGEDMSDPAVQALRRQSVVSAAATFRADGADIMKMEFPVLDLTDRDAAAEACAAVDRAVDGPWVLLSAGVTFEQFRTQLDIAADHGCCGFMAGRAIWGDAVGRLDAARRESGAELAARRLDDLAAVLDGRGAPAWTPIGSSDVAALIGPDWYRTFDEDPAT